MELSPLYDTGCVPELNSHIMESLFFSMSVYEPTQHSVLQDLQNRFGKRVQPLIDYGFEEDGKQAIFVARSPSGRVIVACRGTAGFRDVVQDLKYLQSRLSFVKGAAAHWGFAERAESVPIDFFCKLLGAGEELIFTGHSLGGAVASLLSLRVLESSKGLYDEQVHCITFGCPLFASCRLAELINSNYKEVFTHIVSRRDVVPKLLPFISTLQKLVYADEDHLEGLFVLKNVLLSLLPGVPLASVISGIERRVPSLLKFLFRGFMKLAFPSGMTGSYAFAGHIVMLDTVGPLDRSLVLASADDMNVWHSQLGFAFGGGFDVTMIEEHMLECYHNGILRSLSQVQVRRELTFPGPSLKSSSFHEGDAPHDSSVTMRNRFNDCTDSCQGFARNAIGLDGKAQQQSLVIRFTAPESDHSLDCEIQFRSDSSEGRSSIFVTQNARQQDSGNCGSFSARPSGAEAGSCSPFLTRAMSEGEHNFVRSLGRSVSWRLERSMSMSGSNKGVWASKSERREVNMLGRSKELTIRCRACAHLQVHMNITVCCHKAPRKGFTFGWVLGTIGRVARHLRILDNLCYLTFVRIVVGNLVG